MHIIVPAKECSAITRHFFKTVYKSFIAYYILNIVLDKTLHSIEGIDCVTQCTCQAVEGHTRDGC